MKTSRSFFISAFKSNLEPHVNLNRHTKLRERIKDLGLNKVEGIGSYNNVPELMFVISGDNNTEVEVIRLAFEFEQEAYLIVYGEDSKAEIVYNVNGSRKVIGTMVCKGNEFNTKDKDYSFINDKYYVVE